MADKVNLKPGDVITGREAVATANINGNIVEMFYLNSLEAKCEANTTSFYTLGKRSEQHKLTGWSGTIDMNIKAVTSDFTKIMSEYNKKGKATYFDITVTNEDPTSTIGARTVSLLGVLINSATLVSLNVEADVLNEDVSGTFSDFEILSSFKLPTA